jgi:hypothetical protein
MYLNLQVLREQSLKPLYLKQTLMSPGPFDLLSAPLTSQVVVQGTDNFQWWVTKPQPMQQACGL